MEISKSAFVGSLAAVALGAWLVSNHSPENGLVPLQPEQQPDLSLSNAVANAKVYKDGLVFIPMSITNKATVREAAAEYKRQHPERLIQAVEKEWFNHSEFGVRLRVMVPKGAAPAHSE